MNGQTGVRFLLRSKVNIVIRRWRERFPTPPSHFFRSELRCRLRDAQQNEQTTMALPIVCIGASAGGLESFSELLVRVPADTGMAYVTSVISGRGD